MIKTLNAYTLEIDDISIAINDVHSQLNLENNLLRNSIGLLMCHADFVASGVAKALCDSLPFDVVGTVALANVNLDSDDQMQLTIMILTSDDVKFGSGMSEAFTGEIPDAYTEGYHKALNEIDNKPKLAIAFAPLLLNVSGDYFVNEFDKVADGVPLFGMGTVDHNIDYHDSEVIYNGQNYRDRVVFLLVDGDINPKYYIGTLINEKILREKAVITSSNSNQLYAVNDMPIIDYLKNAGLATDEEGNIISVTGFPFILDYQDGTKPVIRAMITYTPEGVVICAGDVPEGAMLTVGYMDEDIVLESTKNMMEEMTALPLGDVTLFCSCVGRYASQGFDSERESRIVREGMLEVRHPYMFGYGSGEICVVPGDVSDGKIHNRFHNNTIVACTF